MALARAFPAIRARFGAIERGFYLSAIAWFAVFAVACATSLGAGRDAGAGGLQPAGRPRRRKPA
jgi:hypothetical protein